MPKFKDFKDLIIYFVNFVRDNIISLIFLAIGLVLAFTTASYLIIEKQTARLYDINDEQLITLSEQISVGIVFGGGLAGDEPLPLLQDRLDKTLDLIEKDYIDKVILSGYINADRLHDEPKTMEKYLISKGVSQDKLIKDTFGYSTYETCERAAKVFGLRNAILISESTHLPRANYLCRHFGIDAYGVRSDGQASSGHKIGQRWREILARNKAIINVYLIGERTKLDQTIQL